MGKRNGFGRFEENFPGSDVTAEELEFLRAMESYQKQYHRRYPSWREVLGIVKRLGYQKPKPGAKSSKAHG